MEEKKKIKCVIWDLDNTLWHGILSENDQLTLRQDIDDIIKTLDSRGILQSVASKNEHADAMERLKTFDLHSFFLYPQINWGSKSDSVQTIQQKLNIGFDSLLFIDDQIFERDEVASVHPEVRCWDVDTISSLLDKEELMPRFITSESAIRREMYLQDEMRNLEEKEISNNQDFLRGLDMRFVITEATPDDLNRVEELTVRTNQLNATGYTYSYEELKDFMHSPVHKLLICELEDKYGSYGKIGVALVEMEDDKWYINLLLMSCRVMSRGVGGVLLNYLVSQSLLAQKKLYARFFHTSRNRVMYITYKFAGFAIEEQLGENGELLVHTGGAAAGFPDYLKFEYPVLGVPRPDKF
jgi:FkbH-like protein